MTAKATVIQHYDVLIIGGGIAGIAIAELLARTTSLRIKVIDCAPQLGTEASGKLEGWFHAGALYSGHDDAQTFMNCLNGLQDLITLYSSYFPNRCNLVLQERHPNVFVPSVQRAVGGWFHDANVSYILPTHQSPDIKLSRLKSDPVLWEIQRKRVLNRLEASFGHQYNWLQGGQCLAPTLEQIEDYNGGLCSLIEPSGILDALCKRHDESFGVSASHYDIVKSADVSMSPSSIMRDLVASAISNGVDFETGLTIETLVTDRFRPSRLKSLVCRHQNGSLNNLKASVFIFAVGSGFKTLLPQLQLRVKVKMNKSVMAVASPSLVNLNFVRMSMKDKFHFNHLAQHANTDRGPVRYSILANSGFSNDGPDLEAAHDVADLDQLLDAAERYFGKEELYSRRLYSYECIKTEFMSEEEGKRRYSYWIEWNRESNYISVLPGKFSFFPTVAHQTYMKVKECLGFKEVDPKDRYLTDQTHEQLAQHLVAEHYPLAIVAESGTFKLSPPQEIVQNKSQPEAPVTGI